MDICACSSVVERCPDKTEVLGPIPSRRTNGFKYVGRVAELVYAYVSEAYPVRVGSSNLPAPTK